MGRNLSKTYSPKEFEDKIYKRWEETGAFCAKIDKNKKPYTIVMPPPNITGKLHMGHALDQTLQDVLIRYKRMQGYSALWLPGSDHASIATELKVCEKILAEEGKNKEELGREEFLKRAWDWKKEYGSSITKQCRKLGDSCDWSRERFTMDDGCNEAVKEIFVRLYEKGLIYRGNRLINWCPDCATSLSDAEVEHNDKNGKYWYFKYPAENEGDEGIVIATSRPETMFADEAIAVHPSDNRYKDMIGKKVKIPMIGKLIPIIEDIYPDPEKGTGAVKITPAHDMNDFEVGVRHNLANTVCIGEDAKMTDIAGKYAGMDRFECRKAWVKDLEEAGFLVKTEDKQIPSGECYRCKTIVEPMLSEQWFVKMEELAKPAIQAAKSGKLKHIPARFEKIYLHWLENIRDWCISRQLWWGHRIPAYYCQDCNELMVSKNPPEKCTKCGSAHIHQDEDVLDTWFSSALWPFSTLGWPEKTEDFEYFYPTDTLVTGYDIIFFWVVRMVFSALNATGEVPFENVYIHGLVLDEQGRKMSKSLGNGIDPLEVIDKVGADALRFMLTTGITAGNDMRFKEDRLEACRNFANKLWNAARFVIMNLQDEQENFFEQLNDDCDIFALDLKPEDKWIISTVNDTAKYVESTMESFDLSLAAQKINSLIWDEFCDWYIELVKGRLYSGNEDDKMVARRVLVFVLKDLLRLLHPFMPFITEEIWSYLPVTSSERENAKKAGNSENFLIKEKYPIYDEKFDFENEKMQIELAKEAIGSIRHIRTEAKAIPSKKLRVVIRTSAHNYDEIRLCENYIKDIAGITEITYIAEDDDAPKDVATAVISKGEIFIPLDDLLDYEAELNRLIAEKKKLEDEVERVVKKLSNEGFVAKAPTKIIDEEKAKQAKYEEMLKKVSERLKEVEKKVLNAK
ncbi:MAG: valine--tRNA ligase [Eubacteriales bacterium]